LAGFSRNVVGEAGIEPTTPGLEVQGIPFTSFIHIYSLLPIASKYAAFLPVPTTHLYTRFTVRVPTIFPTFNNSLDRGYWKTRL